MDSSEEINFCYRGLSFISLPQIFKGNPPSTSISIFRRLGICLDCVSPCCVCVYLSSSSSYLFIYWFIETHVSCGARYCKWVPCIMYGATISLTNKYFTEMYMCHTSGSRALFMKLTNFFLVTFSLKIGLSTIHTFKNYFAIVFLIFNKINNIQMNPKLSIFFLI